MKYPVLWITGAGLCLALFGGLFDPEDYLIWNRTGSAPEGLYWRSNDPFTPGRWVIVSARSADAEWAEAQGFVGKDWPLLKRIAGIAGDEICRHGRMISINGDTVASAHIVDASGRKLPDWQGCMCLSQTEVFLLNAHPESLDGRYFGATKREDLDGVAIPLLRLETDRDGSGMQSAAKACMDMRSGPGRARYKDVRTRPTMSLSAHPFFVCFCRSLLRTEFAQCAVNADLRLSYAARVRP